MQLSGKYENVRSLWTTSGRDVSNGDTLGFTLVCIDPTEQTTLRMQLSGNAVTHQQMTFDFSLFNNSDQERQRVKIWMLAPAIQNRLKHAIGLADANVTGGGEQVPEATGAGIVNEYALGSNLKGEFFMQFGIVNQMSRGVKGSMRAIDYAKDATACTVPTNSEVLLRFTVGDPSVEREYTDDLVLEFVRGMTNTTDAKKTITTRLGKEKDMPSYTKTVESRDLASEHHMAELWFWKQYTTTKQSHAHLVGLIGVLQTKLESTVVEKEKISVNKKDKSEVPIPDSRGSASNKNPQVVPINESNIDFRGSQLSVDKVGLGGVDARRTKKKVASHPDGLLQSIEDENKETQSVVAK